MATTKEYCGFILEQINLLTEVTCRPMMGEYLLYYNKILFGGIYDNRLLLKKTTTNVSYNFKEVIPYPGAKAMYFFDDIDNKERLREVITNTYEGLKK